MALPLQRTPSRTSEDLAEKFIAAWSTDEIFRFLPERDLNGAPPIDDDPIRSMAHKAAKVSVV